MYLWCLFQESLKRSVSQHTTRALLLHINHLNVCGARGEIAYTSAYIVCISSLARRQPLSNLRPNAHGNREKQSARVPNYDDHHRRSRCNKSIRVVWVQQRQPHLIQLGRSARVNYAHGRRIHYIPCVVCCAFDLAGWLACKINRARWLELNLALVACASRNGRVEK
jgi:hypothetical protein